MKKLAAVLALTALIGLVFPFAPALAQQTTTVRIIATSDLHGKFMPWDYALNEESPSGSMTQLATAVRAYRTENTLLVDAGDTIQDNSADIFVREPGIHPMVKALNALDYDVWVTGNHEYNYGMEVLKKTIADLECTVLVGNVRDEGGRPLADGYALFDVGGARVAVIGMVTPNITRWDAANLAECTVSDPLAETRAILDAIAGQYDVLVGVFHMGIDDEYGMPDSGVTDILNACPEFDVMISSHEHRRIPSMDINGVLVVQNLNMAQTMAVIDLTLERDGDAWKVVDKASESVSIADYPPDPGLTAQLEDDHRHALADAEALIGRLEDGPLAPENEIAAIPTARIEDTALMDLINEVQMYYTGADVSAAALTTDSANLCTGDIRKCDMSIIYRYTNTLYKLHMNGAQLKKFMEWSAAYYNRYQPGDLTVSFNEHIHAYNYYMFAGVNYEINIANPVGSRIENLTWPDGTPVRDDDAFDMAVCNYCAQSQLLSAGEIYDADDLPTLVDIDVRGDIGGIRELIGDYIVNVKGGVIRPGCDDSWRIVGNDWDPALRRRAVEMLAAGELTVPTSEDGRIPNVRAITEADIR